MLSDSIPADPDPYKPELKVEVRETHPRDNTPNLVEIVFTRVWDHSQQIGNVERIDFADLGKVEAAIKMFRAEHG